MLLLFPASPKGFQSDLQPVQIMGVFKKPPTTKPIPSPRKEVRKKDVVFLLCVFFFLFFKLIILFKGVDTTPSMLVPCGVILDFPPKKNPKK